MTQQYETQPAPADALPHAHRHAAWPAWKQIAAYALLAVLAFASIWFIDRRAHVPALTETGAEQQQDGPGQSMRQYRGPRG